MKSTLLATAAAVGLLAVPQAAFASPPDRGFFEANIGFGWTDEDFSRPNASIFDDPTNYGAKTRWLFPLSDPVHFQTDVFFEQSDSVFNGKFAKQDSTLFGGTAHLIHPMEHGRIGAAGSLFSLDAFSPGFSYPTYRSSVEYGLAALEGQYFLEHWTFFGQGGWFGDIAGCDGVEGCVHNGVFFRGNAAYFFTPNASLSFDGNLFWGDDERIGSVSGGTAQLEGEYRLEDSRFAGFVNLKYAREDVDVFSGTAGEDNTTLSLGFRMYLDSFSLFDFSQRGPSMNTPNFHHELTTEGQLQYEAWWASGP
ncbi:MAG: hypothetical protein GC190_11805 [Alphaproteobacteria bacterium]|nr:hypothetical protein [Alphaproteobacteria bacterium]